MAGVGSAFGLEQDNKVQVALTYALEHLVKVRPVNPVEFVAHKLLEYQNQLEKPADSQTGTGDDSDEEIEDSTDEESVTDIDEDNAESEDDVPLPPMPRMSGPPPGFNRSRRTSVSAESFSQRFKYKEAPGPSPLGKAQAKTKDQLERIAKSIEQNFLFRGLEDEQKTDVYSSMAEVKKQAGDVIIQQGDEGDNFYVVDSGQCDVYVSKNRQPPELVTTIGPGGSFGELALMYFCPRAATVKAKSACTLWAVDRVTFRRILMETTLKKRRLYESFIGNVDILKPLNEYERMTVADALESVSYKDGEVVIREGDPGDKFYILEEGKASALLGSSSSQAESVTVKEYTKPGDYFGELALITNQPRAATIVAKGSLKLLSLDRAAFNRLLGSIEKILRRNMNLYTSYESVISERKQRKEAERALKGIQK